MENNYRDCVFWTEHWHVENDKAWMFSAEYNILCEVEFKTQKIKVIDKIPVEQNEERQFSYITKMKNNLILLPDKAKVIMIYDLYKKQWRSIDFYHNYPNRLRCTDGIWINGDLWVYSAGLKRLICLDMGLEKIKKEIIISNDTKILLWDQEIVYSDNFFYISCLNQSQIFKIKIDDGTVDNKKYDEIDDTFRTYKMCKDKLWVVGKSGNIYIFEIKTMKYVNKLEGERCDGIYPYQYCHYHNNLIWLMPYDMSNIWCIDTISYKEKRISIPWIDEDSEVKLNSFVDKIYIRENKFIGISSRNRNYVYEVNLTNSEIKPCDYIFTDKEILYKKIMGNNKLLICENKLLDLRGFIIGIS